MDFNTSTIKFDGTNLAGKIQVRIRILNYEAVILFPWTPFK